jgi:hypothetical protein
MACSHRPAPRLTAKAYQKARAALAAKLVMRIAGLVALAWLCCFLLMALIVGIAGPCGMAGALGRHGHMVALLLIITIWSALRAKRAVGKFAALFHRRSLMHERG